MLYTMQKYLHTTLYSFGGYDKMTEQGGIHQVSKHIIEVRIKPKGRILDSIGTAADSLTGHNTVFDRWSMATRIELTAETNKDVMGFYGHKGFGMVSYTPNPTDFFVTESKRFVRSAWTHCQHIELIRVGVRSMFLTKTEDFKKAVRAYRKKFMKSEDGEFEEFGADLIDVAFPMVFQTAHARFQVSTGAMEKEQSEGVMSEIEPDLLPDVGLYVDVDYFRTDGLGGVKGICELVDAGIQKAEQVNSLIVQWINEQS